MTEVIWPDLQDSMKLMNESDSSYVRHRKLRLLNMVVGLLHFIQGIGQTVLVIFQFGAIKLPIKWPLLDSTNNSLTQTVPFKTQSCDVVLGFPVASLVPAFFFSAAAAHLLIASPACFPAYSRGVRNGYNYFRWIEYSISSSIIMFIIEMLFGIYDLAQLISLFALNVVMNLSNLVMEIHNLEYLNLDAFYIGCFSGITPWIVISFYISGLSRKNETSNNIYAILISYFVFFSLSLTHTLLHYKKLGKWKDYIFEEVGHILISFVTKSTMGWLFFYSFYLFKQ